MSSDKALRIGQGLPLGRSRSAEEDFSKAVSVSLPGPVATCRARKCSISHIFTGSYGLFTLFSTRRHTFQSHNRIARRGGVGSPGIAPPETLIPPLDLFSPVEMLRTRHVKVKTSWAIPSRANTACKRRHLPDAAMSTDLTRPASAAISFSERTRP